MVIKPLNNKKPTSRINQISNKNMSQKLGNRSKTIIPGKDFTNSYAITLKNLDTTIISHVKNVMRPTIREANEVINVPVMYGNEERWVAARKRNAVRDKNGSLILPLIMLKRTSVERSDIIKQGMEHDVRREHAEVVRQTSWSKTNRYDRFSVQTGVQPTIESIVTTMPNFVNVTYEFILWTSYIEQMNSLVESFMEQNYNYWGDSTEYKFLSIIGSIEDASEITADTERIIKSSFTLSVRAYLLPEETNSVITNKISQARRSISPSRISFGFEGDATNEQVGLPFRNTPFGVLQRYGSPSWPESAKIKPMKKKK